MLSYMLGNLKVRTSDTAVQVDKFDLPFLRDKDLTFKSSSKYQEVELNASMTSASQDILADLLTSKVK